jgi:hypothetical protein
MAIFKCLAIYLVVRYIYKADDKPADRGNLGERQTAFDEKVRAQSLNRFAYNQRDRFLIGDKRGREKAEVLPPPFLCV